MNNIIITGATGFIGSILSRRLAEEGYKITIFTRNAESAAGKFPPDFNIVEWDYHSPKAWEDELNRNDAVIHLAGANIFGRRWDEDYKKKILESREVSTRNIVRSIRKNDSAVKVLITASGKDYYGETNEIPVNENSSPGNDFLAEVCRRWEEASFKAEEKGVRRVNMRTGLILSTKDGFLNKLLPVYKLFIGGPLGNSSSWLSWIHIDDVIDAYLYAIENELLKGAVNLSSPNPVINREFAAELGEIMGRPSFFNVPEFALKLIVGEGGSYISHSQKILPEKLLKCGFRFRHPELKSALTDLIFENK
jgi:uncharacterized protein